MQASYDQLLAVDFVNSQVKASALFANDMYNSVCLLVDQCQSVLVYFDVRLQPGQKLELQVLRLQSLVHFQTYMVVSISSCVTTCSNKWRH